MDCPADGACLVQTFRALTKHSEAPAAARTVVAKAAASSAGVASAAFGFDGVREDAVIGSTDSSWALHEAHWAMFTAFLIVVLLGMGMLAQALQVRRKRDLLNMKAAKSEQAALLAAAAVCKQMCEVLTGTGPVGASATKADCETVETDGNSCLAAAVAAADEQAAAATEAAIAMGLENMPLSQTLPLLQGPASESNPSDSETEDNYEPLERWQSLVLRVFLRQDRLKRQDAIRRRLQGRKTSPCSSEASSAPPAAPAVPG